jgi:hypothetical protein
VRAEGEGFLSVWINGHELASLPLSETLEERRARVPAAWLHREANELRLGASAGTAIVDRVTFRRTSR